MAVAAFSGTGEVNIAIPTGSIFPVRSVKWRQETTAATEAAAHIAVCRRMGEFPVGNLQQSMMAGATLVSDVGGLVGAARQIQLIRFRELRYAREFVERTNHLYPGTDAEIMSIYTTGAAPKYTPSPQRPCRVMGILITLITLWKHWNRCGGFGTVEGFHLRNTGVEVWGGNRVPPYHYSSEKTTG